MAKCPVCNTEYAQYHDTTCSNPECSFPLSWYSQSSLPRDIPMRESLVKWAKNILDERSHLKQELEILKQKVEKPSFHSEPASQIQPETDNNQPKVREQQQQIIRRLHELEKADKERENLQVQIEKKRSQMISDIETRLTQEMGRERSHFQSHISQLEEQLKKEKQERSHFNASLLDLQNQLRQLNAERSHFESQISNLETDLQTQLQQKIFETYRQYETWCQNTNQSISYLTTKVGEIETEVAQVKAYSQNKQQLNSVPQINSPTSRSVTATESSQVSASQSLSWEESNLVSKYNINPNIFTHKIEVSETKESNDNRRSGSNQAPILETSRRANYWIISESGFYYLVPSPNLKLNQFNYKTVEAFFKCHNYREDYSQNVRLFKPAQVSPLPGQEKWELIQPGVIQFD
jgi:hypothetical protein